MGEFTKLRSELNGVENISELGRITGLSRDHLQRIRDGRVENTTLRTMETIRRGIRELAEKRPELPPSSISQVAA